MRTVALAVLLLTACGSSVVDDEGTGGSGGSGPGTGTGTGTGTATGTGTGVTTGAGGSDLLCPEFGDIDPPSSVTFRFRNESGEPIFLPTDCSVVSAYVRMGGPAPRDDLSFPWNDSCPAHCEQFQTVEGPPLCSPCAPGATLLAVGEELVVEWPAAALMATQMPPGCSPGGEAVGCEQLVEAPAGAYQLEFAGFSACDECTCDDEGLCNGSPGGRTMQATIPFDLPTAEVEVLLPVCFFGCAGG